MLSLVDPATSVVDLLSIWSAVMTNMRSPLAWRRCAA
jgi:hypothetical protein